MSLAWYVVQVATNMEDVVQSKLITSIIKKIEDHGLINGKDIAESFGVPSNINNLDEIEDFLYTNAILVPKEKIEEIRNGKKKEYERKIFPGYLLIKIEYSDEIGLLIRKTPKVAGFIGVAKDSRPVPIPQSEVDSIIKQVEQSKEKAKHKVEFEVGERIRVVDGPFVDFNAMIEEVLYNKNKLRVNVQIFGRDTVVELDFGQVEKIV